MFAQNNVRYLVVGGLAVNLYGYVRLTMDDLIKLKKGTGRPRDQEDIYHLERIKAMKGK